MTVKTIILAGGLGSRISEETDTRPKPMIEVGGKPLLWHIMQIYLKYFDTEFIIATGYKSEVIDEYIKKEKFDFKVSTFYTGRDSATGERIKLVYNSISDSKVFVTYGDGVANINIKELLNFHNVNNKIATLTAVKPPPRFGSLLVQGNVVKEFSEKNALSEGWINGGFFVLEREVLRYLENENVSFEGDSLPNIAKEDQLMAYFHKGFWKPMDTLRDKRDLQALCETGVPPWL
jgi:glucose-1-phosphate cytidylyltransferase